MTETLSMERFRMLADAYGGVVARWPEAERAAAHRIALTADGAAILAEATMLDAQLDAWSTPAHSPALATRIAAGVPARTRSRRARWWWSGVGFAATLAGAVAGTAAVATVTPIEITGSSTSFGDVTGADS